MEGSAPGWTRRQIPTGRGEAPGFVRRLLHTLDKGFTHLGEQKRQTGQTAEMSVRQLLLEALCGEVGTGCESAARRDPAPARLP